VGKYILSISTEIPDYVLRKLAKGNIAKVVSIIKYNGKRMSISEKFDSRSFAKAWEYGRKKCMKP